MDRILRFSNLFLCVVVLTCFRPAAAASPLEDAEAAYGAGEFREAATLLRPLAVAGDREALFILARLYERGEGVEQDRTQARKYYRLASDKGHRRAGERLAQLEEQDEQGSAQDSVVLDWYLPAARDGDTDAMFNLGFMYETGWGVQEDEAQAIDWYRRAADIGNDIAQLRLGMMLIVGAGDAQDVPLGKAWVRAAAERGNRLADVLSQEVFDAPRERGLDTVKIVRGLRGTIDDGEDKALAILNRAISRERQKVLAAKAAAKTAAARERTVKAARDTVVAEASANPKPLINVAQASFTNSPGQATRVSLNADAPADTSRETVRHLRSAALQGQPDAQFKLGIAYLQGRGVPRDDGQAMYWIRLAAQQGHELSSTYLELVEDLARGPMPATTIAVRWLMEAARNWDLNAFFQLGDIYSQGRGVPRNTERAARWYRIAASGGDAEAQKRAVLMQEQWALPRREDLPVAREDGRASSWLWAITVLALFVAIGLIATRLPRRYADVGRFSVFHPEMPTRRLATGQYALADDDMALFRELWAEPARDAIDVLPTPAQAVSPYLTERAKDAGNATDHASVSQPGLADTAQQMAESQQRRQERVAVAPQPAQAVAPQSASNPERGVPETSIAAKIGPDSFHRVAKVSANAFLPARVEEIAAGRVGPKQRELQRIVVNQIRFDSIALNTARSVQKASEAQPTVVDKQPEKKAAAAQPRTAEAPVGARSGAPKPPNATAEVHYRIGVMFATGEDVPQNDLYAAKWYRKAAEAGHAQAAFDLWEMFEAGLKTGIDASAAQRWLRAAATAGHKDAKMVLVDQQQHLSLA